MKSNAINFQPTKIVKKIPMAFRYQVLYTFTLGLLFTIVAAFASWFGPSIPIFLGSLILSVLMGIVHSIFHKQLLNQESENIRSISLIFTLFISLLGVISFIVFPFIIGTGAKSHSFSLLPIVFLSPYFLHWAYEEYLYIPQKIYSLWYYPYDKEVPIIEQFEYDVKLLIKKKPTDANFHSMELRLPLNKSLGDVMQYLLFQYNQQQDIENQIDTSIDNTSINLYGWLFYKQWKFLNKQSVLDPNTLIKDLGIPVNGIIVAERVLEAKTINLQNNQQPKEEYSHKVVNQN